MIFWRLDDINFAGTMENRPLATGKLERIVDIFESRGKYLNLAVITGYRGMTWKDHRQMFRFLKKCALKGHKIVAHGVAHDKKLAYTGMTDEQIIVEMESMKHDFSDMGFPFDWFCYPFNHRNERTNRMIKRFGLKIIQQDLKDWTKISTVSTWKSPRLSEKKLGSIIRRASAGENIMVEDHCWFYIEDRQFRLLEQTIESLAEQEFVTAKSLFKNA